LTVLFKVWDDGSPEGGEPGDIVV